MPTTTFSSETFKPLLNKLVKTPEYFSPPDLSLALEHLFTPDAVKPTQIGAFLTALHLSRLERRPESLATAAHMLRSRAQEVDAECPDDFIVDIVGTGGDGHDTFNVSTTAAVVAAGAGARVIKHGSRASTSSSGSADLLESLNCSFSPPTPGANPPFNPLCSATAIPLPRIPFTFILAPHYHPVMAALAPHRKLLPFRTMFNVLGPLINPARPKGMVLGVAEPELGHTFAQSLRDGGVKKALVVCGEEKLDELSCAGRSHVWELSEGQITEYMVEPELDFGLERHPLKEVAGKGPVENAEIFTRLLNGSRRPALDTEEQKELKPVLDFVLMNASALLVVAGLAKDFKHGVELARESVDSGQAWEAFETFRDIGRVF